MSSPLIFLDEVELVAHEQDANALLSLREERVEPEFDVLKGLSPRNVVHNEATEGFPIVSHRDSAVLFLTCRVPELRLHCRSILHYDIFRCELHTDGWPSRLGQLVLQVPTKQARFTHRDISNEDDWNRHDV